ncbi:SGNH/GDSL hydrolase family protein [Leptolyngbya boryana CZ1]|uniref:SGNH/GDSL hydrolase family protein n=1 Tax=Leptolyngbya boryana CZ1 TaxID=3060204 RepID=A0AA97AQJ1_LEPBY|nr:SGNH/GDSL hydrolase family protein [Leptolyngbya boryana]WNZ45699.1 SGNH/GDSL hydrolase family protein [Leptolyngbya boryana CZ1]
MKRVLKIGLLFGFTLLASSPCVLPAVSSPKVDKLPSVDWWRSKVSSQITASTGKRYTGCVFGDSISSGLGNSLGQSNYNFAMGGMSTVSLLEQLKQLKAGNIQCQKVIVAIGTNDAMYSINNVDFKNNLRQIVTLTRGLGASEITLLPAFYSTVEASKNPNVAGTLDRVDEINTLIRQVGTEQDVTVRIDVIQPLFRDRALRGDLTLDGVHLNDSGKRIYRQALLDLLNSAVSSR